MGKENSADDLELPSLFDSDEPLFLTKASGDELEALRRIELQPVNFGGTGGEGDADDDDDDDDGDDGAWPAY